MKWSETKINKFLSLADLETKKTRHQRNNDDDDNDNSDNSNENSDNDDDNNSNDDDNISDCEDTIRTTNVLTLVSNLNWMIWIESQAKAEQTNQEN